MIIIVIPSSDHDNINNKHNKDDDDDDDKNNLREVGVPSRNILHVRGRGSKSRIRVAGRVRGADAQKVT